MEPLRSKTNEGQCYNCQKFGHAQNRYHAAPVCVKCCDGYSSRDCTVERTTSARCGNCRSSHPASYGACSENPKTKRPAKKTEAWGSYASMARKTNGEAPKASKTKKSVTAEESPSLAAVMQDTFFAKMERVMLDMQKGMTQLAESMKRAQLG